MATNTLITDELYERYLVGLLEGNRALCNALVKHLCAEKPELKDLYVNLFQRSLYEVGELWENHQISVAVEHLATAITERGMALVLPEVFSGSSRDRSLVVASVADEYHQLGARMVADLAEMHGWRGYFLGANTPLAGLLEVIQERQPDLVGLSLSVYFNLTSMEKTLDAVVTTFPGLPVVVGGQAFRPRWGGSGVGNKSSSVMLSSSLDDLEKVLIER